MKTVSYIKWSNSENTFGGTVRFSLNGEMFTFEKVSGSCIPTEALIELLWHYPSLKSLRDVASSLTRKNSWKLGEHIGMSGCRDFYIQFLTNTGLIKRSNDIIHVSMNDLQNRDIKDIWIKDIFDCLWGMKLHGYFAEAFNNDEPDAEPKFGYVDVTNDYIRRIKEFMKDSFSSSDGFGTIENSEVINHEEELVDYSNYVPADTGSDDDQ